MIRSVREDRERIGRIGEFPEGTDAGTLGLDGSETFHIRALDDMAPGGEVTMEISARDGRHLETPLRVRIDTSEEMDYFRAGGILSHVLRRLI